MSWPIAHVDPSIISSVIEANINAHRLAVARLPNAILSSTAERTWVDSGLPDATLNAVVQARFSMDTVDQQVETVLDHFRRRMLPVAWHIGPTSEPSNLDRVLLAHGMTHGEDEPGMAIEIDRMDEQSMPPGLTIETVHDERGLADWIAVWLFPVPDDIRRRHLDVLCRLGLGGDLPWRYYVGWLNGLPVATAKLFVGEGVAAVHLVVTLPDVRRQGIGSAMTRHVLHEARSLGYQVGVLTASPFGIDIYRRIGFREYCWFRQYMWEPS